VMAEPMDRTDSTDMNSQIADHVGAVEWLRGQIGVLERMADALVEVFRAGGHLYLLGNGGSAADAQHIATELVGRFLVGRRALPAVALTCDGAILTAVGNDFDATHVFLRQVEAHVGPDDAVWALSVSGTSPNVLAAVKRARQIGATILGFTGRSGGALAECCDHCLRVDHVMTPRVQEVHELAYHLVCHRIEQAFR